MSPQELAAWADKNGVDLRVPGEKLPLVNARRAELELPPFKVVRPAAEQTLAVPRMPLIASSRDEFREYVQTYPGTKTGLLSSACALWGLEYNTGNRSRVRAAVARFATIIREGQWLNTSEPIIFSREALNDGQHRLMAIAQVGIAVEVDVRFGVERDAFMATNTGARRTAGQALHIMGARNSVPQAAVARLLYLYDHGRLGANAGRTVETADILATIAANPAISAVAEFMVHSNFTPTRTAPFGMVIAAAVRATTLDRALAFAAAVTTGREPDGDASRALHVRMRDMRMRGKNLGPIDVATLTMQAWNAWVVGKPAQLRLTKEDQATGFIPKIQSGEGTPE